MPHQNINVEKLIEVLNIQSHSKDESRMVQYLVDKILDMIENGEDIFVEYDEEGNIYITKGLANFYPTVVSHIDTVHDVNMNAIVKYNENGDLIAFDTVKNEQYGIGGDDKVGVYVCLDMLSKFDTIKVAFFSREEIGCVGSGACRMEFFDDSAFLIQCDRRGANDFIKYGHGIQLFNEDFENDLNPLLEKWGYKIEMGGQTDIVELKEKGLNVACFNMSCGYYMPHTSTEYIRLDDVDRCAGLVYDIINDMSTKPYNHEFAKKPTSYSKYSIKDLDDFYAGRPVDIKKKNDKREEVIHHPDGSRTVITYNNDVKTSTAHFPPNWNKMSKREKKEYKAKKKAIVPFSNVTTKSPLLLPARTSTSIPAHMEWDQDAYNGWSGIDI